MQRSMCAISVLVLLTLGGVGLGSLTGTVAPCPLTGGGTPVSGAGVSATGIGALDYFTGGGSYMPRTHCLRTPAGTIDWPWIVGLLLLTAGVIAAYLRIFAFWMKSYFAEQKRDRNGKLLDLSGIFLWCAICGYGFSIVMFFWPGYRLLAFALVVLNIFSWRFVRNLEPFRLAFAANRLQRELNESLKARAEELERLVAERTREAESARAQADNANKAKSEFLANMSHEIRTPLTAVLGFADILTDAHLEDPAARDAAQTISRNSRHLLAIINDILDLSKIESGQLTVERLRVGLMESIDEVVDLMRAKASAKGLLLVCEPLEPLPAVIHTDPTRLRQILANLIGNAIKFTERGSVRVRVRHAESDGEGRLTVEVSDTGIGITDEHMARLFEPFSQADATTTRRFGGTGLGLTISRRLARLLGGDVTCTSRPGIGSTFTLTLGTGGACSESDAPVEIGAPASVGPAPSATALKGRRVLLVDDGADNRKLIGFLLRRAGAEVALAENGLQAVEAAMASRDHHEAFDLILMDMQMPELDGYEATRRLRERGYGGLIVALTANAMIEERERCLGAGCDDYLTKPISRGELVGACLRLLHERRGAPI